MLGTLNTWPSKAIPSCLCLSDFWTLYENGLCLVYYIPATLKDLIEKKKTRAMSQALTKQTIALKGMFFSFSLCVIFFS